MLYVLKNIAIHKNSKPYRMTKEGPADINALAAHTTKAFKMDWNVKNRLKLIWTAYQIAKRARSGTKALTQLMRWGTLPELKSHTKINSQ